MKYVLVFLADWANGIFALVAAAYVFDVSIQWWHVPIALLLAMSPDIDAITEVFTRGTVAASAEHPHDHRDGLHYPIPVLVILGVCVYFFGFWAAVWFLAVLLHFINDTYGTGWGIKWLWPISGRQYKILGRRVNRLKYLLVEQGDWNQLPESERSLRLVVSWSSAEIPVYMKRWGVEDWIGPWYLRLNWISGTEYALFLVACVLLAVYVVL